MEVGVRRSPRSTRVADVAVFKAPLTSLQRAYWSPDDLQLVVEIVSDSSQDEDRYVKPRWYAQAGIPEYWRVEEGDDGDAVIFQYRLARAASGEGGYVESGVTTLSRLETHGWATGPTRRAPPNARLLVKRGGPAWAARATPGAMMRSILCPSNTTRSSPGPREGPPVSRAPSPTVRRRRLGAELRRLREAAGLTGDQVVERVGWASSSKISRIENGRSRPGLADVLTLLDLYRVTGRDRDQLITIARDAGNTRAWLRAYPVMTKRQREYAELEAGCSEICEYGQLVVPGLLQAPGYARWRILGAHGLGPTQAPRADEPAGGAAPPPSSGGDIDTEVAARGARQGLLSRSDPPRYEAVLEEWAFTARAGPPDVLADQLEHLCRLADLPHVTLRVLSPNAVLGDWYVPATSFSIYRFTDPDDPGTVAIEALGHDVLLSDNAALLQYLRVFDWLRDAARSPEDSRRWFADAADAAHATTPAEAATRAAERGSPPLSKNAPPTKGGDPAGRTAAPPAQRGPHKRRVEPYA
jgi:transcriptional regulator with XRE-family HTH domain